MATTRFLCAGVIAAVIAGAGLAGALPEVYSKQGRYPVTTTVLTVQRSEGIGLPFQCTVYYPTNEGAGGGRCTDVASCYLQSIGTAQNAPVADAGNFPLVAFGLNTFISGQEVYGSTMRHIASHGFVVAATNSRYIQPAAEAIEMVDCINELEKQQTQASSKFHNKLDLKAGVGVLGYSQGGAASLDTAARLGDRCSGCITQHAQPSMMASQIKCPVFLHSGDQDSLTGIMKAMIWSGVRTPKVRPRPLPLSPLPPPLPPPSPPRLSFFLRLTPSFCFHDLPLPGLCHHEGGSPPDPRASLALGPLVPGLALPLPQGGRQGRGVHLGKRRHCGVTQVSE